MLTQISPKKPQIFNCEKCIFSCSKQKDWNRHILTRKHQKIDQCLPKVPLQKPAKKYICECGKECKNKQAYSAHKRGCSVLPKKELSSSSDKKKFKQYPIGYFHIDIAEVRTAEGKLYLYVAIDRTSKFTYAQLHKSQTKMIAAEFLHDLISMYYLSQL